MKKILLILMIFCFIGVSAMAQVQTDSIVSDGLAIKKYSPETNLPQCNSDKEGKITYYAPTDAPGFSVQCVDNGGLYELQPITAGSAGYVWTSIHFDATHLENLFVGSNTYADHPVTGRIGNPYIFTDGIGTDSGYLSAAPDSSTDRMSIPAGDTSWTTEWVVKVNSTASVKYLVGLSSEWNTSFPDEDLAIFRFDTDNLDTNWQAVTRDNTTETETETDTGVAVSSSNWYRFIIVRTSSDIKFYVGVNGADVSLVATHTTNLPNTEGISPYIEVREKEALVKQMNMDYFRFSKLGLDP